MLQCGICRDACSIEKSRADSSSMQPCPRERQTAVGGALSCKRLEAVIGRLLGEKRLVRMVVEPECPPSATDDFHSTYM